MDRNLAFGHFDEGNSPAINLFIRLPGAGSMSES
jgi:hypothetical protein